MSNENEQQKDAEFPDGTEHAVEEAAEEQPALPAPEPAARRGSGGIAWLALFLALVAAAGAGYMAFEDWRARNEADRAERALADLRSRLASSDESLAGLDSALAGLATADARTAAELDALQADVEGRIQLLDSLPQRMSTLESSVATLQGVSAGARNTWLLAEAEYYMQIANAQLQLAGNPHLASLALAMADERVAQVADPALIEVRRALSDELAALDGVEKPDIQGMSLTLSSLARVVATLPLKATGSTAARDDAGTDESASGLQRAWTSVKGAMSGLVRVTPPDETAIPLMTPDAEYFLRTNLTLQLQVARLALLRGEQAVFEQSLDDAAAWLGTYFDTENAQVRGADATITEIRAAVPVVAAPDISESLRLLRQFKTLAGNAQ